MDKRIKKVGIGALTVLLMVAMLVAPAAAADVILWTGGPSWGYDGCKDQNGDLLTGNGVLGESDIGMVIRDNDKDGLDGFDPNNPPYYLVDDDEFLKFAWPNMYVIIGVGDTGNGGFCEAIFDAPAVNDNIYVRLFNDISIEQSTYYGDSELYVVPSDDTHEFPNWDTTIPIDWGGETFDRELVAGWNLVSLPLTPEDNSVSVVLASITGNYDAVKSYNAATNQFEDATTMDPGVGYFIHTTSACTWSYEGTAYTSMTADLSQGLNMVGWTNTNADLPGALDSIVGNYRYVARWNAGTQSYEVYLPGAPAVFNDFEAMDQGEGYFIAATAECTLTYPSSL